MNTRKRKEISIALDPKVPLDSKVVLDPTVLKQLKKNGFFQSAKDLLKDEDPEMGDLLNKRSASCQKYQMNEKELNELKVLNAEKEGIEKKIEQLKQEYFALQEKSKDLQFCEDSKLCALLINHMQSYPKINCSIDKLGKFVTVIVHDCDDKNAIKNIFERIYSKGEYNIETHSQNNIDDHAKIIVTFKLRDLDGVMEGLSKQSQSSDVLRSRNYFPR